MAPPLRVEFPGVIYPLMARSNQGTFPFIPLLVCEAVDATGVDGHQKNAK